MGQTWEQEHEVMSVGDGRWLQSGKREDMNGLAPGDRVLIEIYQKGENAQVMGRDLVSVPIERIRARIPKDSPHEYIQNARGFW